MPPWGKDPDTISVDVAFRAMCHFLARTGGASVEITGLLRKLADRKGHPASDEVWRQFRAAVDAGERDATLEGLDEPK